MTSPPGMPASEPAGSAARPPRRLRASDADRAAVVARLQQAVGRGLLSLQEGDERMAAAFAARYVDELSALFADLPAPAPPGPPAVGWRRLGESLVTQLRYEVHATASSGLRSRRFLVSLVAVVLFVALVLAVAGALLHGVADPDAYHQHFFHRDH